MKKVLFLFGGNSSEHYISCLSLKSVLKNINKDKFDVTSIGISKDNKWYLFDDNFEYLSDNSLEFSKYKEIDNIVNFVKNFDVVFPLIHGKYGEDGRIQGFLETFDIPYVGSNHLSSALGMDKDIAKIIFNNSSIPQVPYICFTVDNFSVKKIMNNFSFPLIIKPCNGGSSIGIYKVNNRKELIECFQLASKYDEKIIIEPFLKVRELECAVIEDDDIIVSNVGEIIPSNEFYDYDAKYENSDSKVIIPANIPHYIKKSIRNYAKKAFLAIGAKSLARIDFFYDEINNKIFLNEINTLPGFTDISMYPMLIMNEGYTYEKIITKLIYGALKKKMY